PTEQVVENTATLKNDIGFISYPVEHGKLVVREILEDRLVIIAPPGHPLTRNQPLTPRDLEGESMIMLEEGSAPRRAVDELIRSYGLSITIPLELSSNRAIKRAVEAGIGIALLSLKVAHDEIQARRLTALPLSEPSMKRKFFMVHHKEKYISESLQRLIDMVFKFAQDHAEALS
ncbi:MAG: hypothetical protein JSW39_01290, partial [Desulfobacterales bacterium]